MLKITIELISAIDGHQELVGIGYIINDGSGTPMSGNYDISIMRGKELRALDRSHITNFPREIMDAWDLLYIGLQNISENKIIVEKV